MWDEGGFLAKAHLYFGRGSRHDRADDEFTLWLLLGLEFVLRMPLARVHPTLLAVPEGPSIMAAAGFPGATPPRSVSLKTVINRLQVVVPDFTKEHGEQCIRLLNLRNEELHTSAATLQNIRGEDWLPLLYNVLTPVCAHLGLAVDDLLTRPIAQEARALAVEADQKLAHEIEVRIEGCRTAFDLLSLSDQEVTDREFLIIMEPSNRVEVLCPACTHTGAVIADPVRLTSQRLDDDELVFDAVLVPTSYRCTVCGLTLANPSEIKAAGLPLSYTVERRQSVGEWYGHEDAGWDDYGND